MTGTDADFNLALDQFLHSAPGGVLTLVAADPATPLARRVWSRLPDFLARGVTIRVVFGPACDKASLRAAVVAFEAVFGKGSAHAGIARARSASARTMIEQASFGLAVWTGGRLSGAHAQPRCVSTPDDAGGDAAKAARLSFAFVQALAAPVSSARRALSVKTLPEHLAGIWQALARNRSEELQTV